MGAIAVSKEEERQIERLEKKAEEERLRREIQESVRRCAGADKKENRELFHAGVGRRISGE